jgi:tetratricopeptide (TPR) repeat protein
VARKLLITGISNFPNSKNIAWFHCALAHISYQQGSPSTARACYQRALTSSPPQESLPILIEFILMEISDGAYPYPAAKKLLEVATKLFPSDPR